MMSTDSRDVKRQGEGGDAELCHRMIVCNARRGLDKVQLEVNINRMVTLHVNYRGKRDILPSLKPPPSRRTSLMHQENRRHATQPSIEPDLDVTAPARSSETRNALAAG